MFYQYDDQELEAWGNSELIDYILELQAELVRTLDRLEAVSNAA